MKFKSLSNKEIRLEITAEQYPMRSRTQSRSLGQYTLGRLLRSIYGTNAIILEEFTIPEERLFLDFYLPHYNLAFEYQGEQHDSFNKFFHTDKTGFEKSKARDLRKRNWCEINNITLIEVRGNITSEDLKKIILKMEIDGDGEDIRTHLGMEEESDE